MDKSVNRKFVASYSGGKDSALALHRAIKAGYEPVALITTFNEKKKENWFHGLDDNVLGKISDSMNIPVWKVITDGSDYDERFVNALIKARGLGAEVCVFGDIFIEEHFRWCENICRKAGVDCMFPLAGDDTKLLLKEFIDSGFKGNITIVDLKKLDTTYLGKVLNDELLVDLENLDVDICGEFGEYHTFVSDGPVFFKPVEFRYGAVDLQEKGYAKLPLII